MMHGSTKLKPDLLFEDVFPLDNPGLLNILINICEGFTASCIDYDL